MEKRFDVIDWDFDAQCYAIACSVDTWEELQALPRWYGCAFHDKRTDCKGYMMDLPPADMPIMDEFELMEMSDEEFNAMIAEIER